MQDVARREAELAEKSRLLRTGMTVAEALDVMGPPDAVEVIVESPEDDSIRDPGGASYPPLLGASARRAASPPLIPASTSASW
jgi:hypothetical protein